MRLNLDKLRREAKKFRKKDKNLTLRLLALIELAKREHSGNLSDLDYELVGLEIGKSGRTVYRWRKSYLEGGHKKLAPRKAPGRQAEDITGWTAHHIRRWRKLCGWGAEVIQAHLKRYLGVELSLYRIHRFLKNAGLVGSKRRAKPASSHTTVVKVELPGVHTQIDVNWQTTLLENGKKCYVYNFVDHASRWEFKRAYEGYGHWETERFMIELLRAVPFWITSTQTDNGVEFTNKFVSRIDDPLPHILDELCDEHGIRHRLIPPGEKELNGLVERSHRMDDEELFHRAKPQNIEQLNEYLEQYCQWKNSWRLRKALGWKSANEYLLQYPQVLKPGAKEKLLVADTQSETTMKAA
ncbi:MAG: DDE-type integrase/transposase/recombinase [Pseudobdellovibrionaceae bacterium]|nr:MAG: DDE-type integrase/transposase/recombinase [Pseudobdellovibrionaceae bacterium]